MASGPGTRPAAAIRLADLQPMHNLRLGTALCTLAAICMALVGGVGPCGPSGPFGVTFLGGAILFGIAGWIVCVVDLAQTLIKGAAEILIIPAMLVTLLVMVVPVVLVLRQDDSGFALSGIWFWPFLVAVGVLIKHSTRR